MPCLRLNGSSRPSFLQRLVAKLAFGVRSRSKLTVEVVAGRLSFRMSCANQRELRRAATLFLKEPMTADLLANHLRTGEVVWDIGANVGLYTLLAAQSVGPSGKVVAFEPMAANFKRLVENVSLNGIGERVSLLSLGLSDRTAPKLFFYDDPTSGATGSQFDHAVNVSGKPFRPVVVEIKQAMRGDDLVQSGLVPAPDIIKLDVDGHEHAILDGLSGVLGLGRASRRPRLVLVEVNPGESTAIQETMSRYGYELERREATASSQRRIDAGKTFDEVTHNAVFRPRPHASS